jgi:hypothetical protein
MIPSLKYLNDQIISEDSSRRYQKQTREIVAVARGDPGEQLHLGY